MEKKLKYSVLRYTPSLLAGESINLGILFSDISSGFHSFYYSSNQSRIRSFDDEINPKTLKLLLEGIKVDVEKEGKEFILDDFIKFYINNYRFDTPKELNYKKLDETISDLKTVYFRYDIPLSNRPDRTTDQKILANLLTTSGIQIYRNKIIEGKYQERIQYDIATDDYYVKLFDFDQKDLKRCINSAKVWAYNSDQEKDKKVFVLYRCNNESAQKTKEFQIISSIFNDSKAHFHSIEDGVKILQRNA